MTQKTKNLTADEALNYFMQSRTVIGQSGREWNITLTFPAGVKSPSLADFIIDAPFHLALRPAAGTYTWKDESNQEEAPSSSAWQKLREQLDIFSGKTDIVGAEKLADVIYFLIRDEARKIAEECAAEAFKRHETITPHFKTDDFTETVHRIAKEEHFKQVRIELAQRLKELE